jgi:hypothetical protein
VGKFYCAVTLLAVGVSLQVRCGVGVRDILEKDMSSWRSYLGISPSSASLWFDRQCGWYMHGVMVLVF